MYEWLTIAVQGRTRELYLNAEEYQLMKAALEARQPAHKRWLAGVGRRLSHWGDRLQAANLPPQMRAQMRDTQEVYSVR